MKRDEGASEFGEIHRTRVRGDNLLVENTLIEKRDASPIPPCTLLREPVVRIFNDDREKLTKHWAFRPGPKMSYFIFLHFTGLNLGSVTSSVIFSKTTSTGISG